MFEYFKKKQNFFLFLLFSAIIFIFHIWYIHEIRVLVIRNDEYGYWAHAALFTGHDWSEVLSNHMTWYSYGYSLILVPLFYITTDLYLMYKLAIILNGIFGICTYLICFLCARRLFSRLKNQTLLIVSFLVCMYSSYITQGQIAWSETFLYLTIWLLLYLFLRFEQAPSTGSALLLSACMGYCYLVHNRTIGIVAAYLIIALLLKLTGRITWQTFTALLSPLLFILLVNGRIKTYLCMIEGFGLKPKNSLAEHKEHLLSLLTLQGWKNFFCSLSGQLWCLSSSTFGLIFWGFVRCIKQTLSALLERKKQKHTCFYLFTLLGTAATFSISAISFMEPGNVTYLSHDTDLSYFIYTRYDECMVGILLLLGFLELAYFQHGIRVIQLGVLELAIYTLLGTVLSFNLKLIESTWHYRPFCVAGISYYRIFSEDFSVLFCSFFTIGISLAVLLLLTFPNSQYLQLRRTLSCILLICIFVPVGLYSASSGTIASQRGKKACGNLAMYRELGNVIGSYPVYCTLDNTQNFRIAYELQVNLINTKVYSLTVEDLPVNEENYFICCSKDDLDKWKGEDYYLLTQSNEYAVLAKGTHLKEEIQPLASKKLENLNDINLIEQGED